MFPQVRLSGEQFQKDAQASKSLQVRSDLCSVKCLSRTACRTYLEIGRGPCKSMIPFA